MPVSHGAAKCGSSCWPGSEASACTTAPYHCGGQLLVLLVHMLERYFDTDIAARIDI